MMDLSIFLKEYLDDAREGFQKINNGLLALENDHSRLENLDGMFRVIHSLKSSSAMLGFEDVAGVAHRSEDLLDRMRKREVPVNQETIDLLFEITDTLEGMIRDRTGQGGRKASDWAPSVEELKRRIKDPGAGGPSKSDKGVQKILEIVKSVRVETSLLDDLFNLVGELIISKNRLDTILSDIKTKELKAVLSSMDHLVRQLQEGISTARLVPVEEIFQKFPRLVRDLAREAGKEVEFLMEGGEIELDKTVLDAIGDPLVHLLRNAVDHGIEPPAVRRNKGKSSSGTITLTARRAEEHILVAVEDDGEGIDTGRLKEIFMEKGLLTPMEATDLKEREILDLLFRPGFTSTGEVTDISGRGVGLDVVRNSAREIGGTAEVSSKKGEGTRFTLKLPLTTAVMHTLMVGVGRNVFAIPSAAVVETMIVGKDRVRNIHDRQVMVLRREVIPFARLDEMLGLQGAQDVEQQNAVIISSGGKSMALGVDTILDQMENIIKPFDPIARQFKGFSGGTILGDGSVALLLDLPGLIGTETQSYQEV